MTTEPGTSAAPRQPVKGNKVAVYIPQAEVTYSDTQGVELDFVDAEGRNGNIGTASIGPQLNTIYLPLDTDRYIPTGGETVLVIVQAKVIDGDRFGFRLAGTDGGPSGFVGKDLDAHIHLITPAPPPEEIAPPQNLGAVVKLDDETLLVRVDDGSLPWRSTNGSWRLDDDLFGHITTVLSYGVQS